MFWQISSLLSTEFVSSPTQYKATYENVILVGSGTYGSVYYVR